MSALELGNLVTYNPLVVHEEDSLQAVVEYLRDGSIHHLPVVDHDRRLVGVLSEQDLTRAVAQRCAAVPVGAGGQAATLAECAAREIMSRPPATLEQEQSVEDALSTMLARDIHCLPVLDGKRLVAILTTTDLLREFSFGELPVSREALNDHLINAIDFVTPEDSIDLVQKMLDRQQLDCVPVMQGACPLGLITRRELRKNHWRKALALASEAAELEESHEAKSPYPVEGTVMECVLALPPLRPGQKLSAAAATMVEHHAQAVAVVNQAKRLLGVVTEDLLLRLMLAELQGERG